MITIRTTVKPDSKYSLKKGERLSGRAAISTLFKTGSRTEAIPIRLIYQLTDPGTERVSMAAIVPKRLIRKAVDRNLLKRRIREVYRTNKPGPLAKDRSLHLLIQYRSEHISDYRTIEKAYKKAVKAMMTRLEQEASE